MTSSKQSVSDKMQNINSKSYNAMNNEAVRGVYTKKEDTKTFKDCYVFAIGTSFVELPDMPLTKEEFDIDESKIYGEYTTTTQVSTAFDIYSDFIINSKIEFGKINKIKYALEHLNALDNVIDLKEYIVLYDQEYSNLEIMFQHFLQGSYFVIRAKDDSLEKYQSIMTEDGLIDETFNIRLSSSRLKHFKNRKLKIAARKLRYVNVRIVKVMLENGTEETLFTNIPEKLVSPLELKELYFKNSDRLNNSCIIEKINGKDKFTIEQNFYSGILAFNLLTSLKNDLNSEINVNSEENIKYEYVYQNIGDVIDEVREIIQRLIIDNKGQSDYILQSIFDVGSKYLVKTEIDTTSE